MEPDVIRLYSSSPPPLEETGEEEEGDEFGEFGSFCGGGVVSSSFSFSEIDTPTTFNRTDALDDSPPDLYITSMQDVISVLAVEQKNVGESKQSYVVSGQDITRNVTEEHICFENTEKDSSEVIVNGVEYSDLIVSSSLPLPTGVRDNSTEEHLDNTNDGHSHLSNGYSESSANDTESCVSFEADNEFNEQNLPSLSCQDTSKLEETKATIELNDDFQSLRDLEDAGIKTARREDDGTKETAIPDTPVFSSHGNVDPCVLDEPTNCIDTAEATTAHSKGTDLISDAQLTGDTSEIQESSMNIEAEAKVNNKSLNDETSQEDFGDFRDASQGFTDFSRTESVTREGFADFVTAMSMCSTDEEFGDTDTLKDFQEEDELAEEEENSGDCVRYDGAFCSELPPSDSFADFSSAPFSGVVVGEGENWASFGQQEAEEGIQDSWATFGEEQNVMTSAPCSDNLESTKTERDEAKFCSKIHHLFRNAFPSDANPEINEVIEVSSLENVLQDQDSQDQRDADNSLSQRYDLAMWSHLQEIHGAYGLKFKWAGSHSNRILLDCLGIRNIVFTGEKKQPLIVPMFAAGLGLLEPTKESQNSLAAPALSPPVPVQGGSLSCTQVAQSLNVSIDGIDPELYELTTAKMETKSAGHSIADAFTKLIESMEKTTTVRKPEKNEKISEEAAKIISRLPDLSFMQARVLMFPSILTPAANHK